MSNWPVYSFPPAKAPTEETAVTTKHRNRIAAYALIGDAGSLFIVLDRHVGDIGESVLADRMAKL